MELKYQPGDLIAYIPSSDPNDLSDISIVIRYSTVVPGDPDHYIVFEIKTQRYEIWNRAFVEEPESWKLIQ